MCQLNFIDNFIDTHIHYVIKNCFQFEIGITFMRNVFDFFFVIHLKIYFALVLILHGTSVLLKCSREFILLNEIANSN